MILRFLLVLSFFYSLSSQEVSAGDNEVKQIPIVYNFAINDSKAAEENDAYTEVIIVDGVFLENDDGKIFFTFKKYSDFMAFLNEKVGYAMVFVWGMQDYKTFTIKVCTEKTCSSEEEFQLENPIKLEENQPELDAFVAQYLKEKKNELTEITSPTFGIGNLEENSGAGNKKKSSLSLKEDNWDELTLGSETLNKIQELKEAIVNLTVREEQITFPVNASQKMYIVTSPNDCIYCKLLEERFTKEKLNSYEKDGVEIIKILVTTMQHGLYARERLKIYMPNSQLQGFPSLFLLDENKKESTISWMDF